MKTQQQFADLRPTTPLPGAPGSSTGHPLPKGEGQSLLPYICVLILGLAAYASSLRAPFIFDDSAIREDPQIRSLWPPTAVLTAPVNSPLAGRPVVGYSLAINYALGGYNPWGYHAFNLIAHLLCALLLLGIMRATLLSPYFAGRFKDSATWLATAAASLWVAHPLASEPVLYVLQRTELLASLFYLLTLWCAIRSWGSTRAALWVVASVAACALGMGSKEIMFYAPLFVLLFDRTFHGGSFTAALKRHRVLYTGLAATWLIMVGLYMSAPRGRSVSLWHADLTPLDYLRTQAGVIVWYLRLCFWPHPLSIIYDWRVVHSWGGSAPAGVLVLALLLGVVWCVYRRWAVGVAGALFFLVLAPSSSFIPMITELVAERRMYLPLAAVISIVVVSFATLLARISAKPSLRALRPATIALACVLAASLALATARRVADYRSAPSIWRSALALYPNSLRGLGNYAAVLVRAGDDEGAVPVFQRMIALAPDRFDARIAAGNSLYRLHRYDQAIPLFSEALRQAPGAPQASDARVVLANCLALTGRLPAAQALLEDALRLDPPNGAAQKLLAALRAAGQQPAPAAPKSGLSVVAPPPGD